MAETLPVELDVGGEIAELLARDAHPMITEVTVFMTNNYHAALAVQFVVAG